MLTRPNRELFAKREYVREISLKVCTKNGRVSEKYQNENLPEKIMMISMKLKRDTQAKEEKKWKWMGGENRN